jgi:hypothetical protein
VKAVANNYVRDFKKKEIQVFQDEFIGSEFDEKSDSVGPENGFSPAGSKNSVVTESHINFIDLAGSEKVSSHFDRPLPKEDEVLDNCLDSLDEKGLPEKTMVGTAQRVKEGKAINKSLFFLTQVISLKAKGKSNEHIPFRNSPLTKILKGSLGGNFRTVVILCCNPSNRQQDHTISTLRFGMNAKKIQNHVKANIVTNNNEKVMR